MSRRRLGRNTPLPVIPWPPITRATDGTLPSPGGASVSEAPGARGVAARNSYLRWDPIAQAVCEWDGSSNQWEPVDR